MYTVVSSANNIDVLLFRHKGRPFVYKINKSGPRIDHCGTRNMTGKRSTVITTNILFPNLEIAFEPFEWRTPYQKDLMVYCIKCFT